MTPERLSAKIAQVESDELMDELGQGRSAPSPEPRSRITATQARDPGTGELERLEGKPGLSVRLKGLRRRCPAPGA